MSQATQHTRTGLIPAPRTAPDGSAPVARAVEPRPERWGAVLARCSAVARGLRSLRPVAAKEQPSYGEVDGQ
ncbi:hypothetical protein [Kitasatospora griseola]|uniref:Uncharacterized protein n=1 Tax=Kitasatospora griseola TaxID=2064 RepID=A0A0D0PS31_KITGR|nr:hypothetical protein [Kitasatospora griseola]KIQ63182.1 hypothetical protein TR51_30985 [Kitasatospora griseola]GGQ89992.1 hypothetical protein GCM10010195_52430 [Kitasatospora griseola]